MSITLVQAEVMGTSFSNQLATSRFWEKDPTPLEKVGLQHFIEYLPGKKVLDVGCGYGQYAPLFLSQGREYLGIDYSPEMIRAAKALYPKARFEIMSFNRLTFKPGSFAGIWACRSITNTPKAIFKESLKTMHSILIPRGILVVVVPNLGCSCDGLIGDVDKPYWLAAYHPEEIRSMLRSAGFQVNGTWVSLSTGTLSVLAIK
jgi:SAM-dependent methyltransferase